ncbi:MAG: hypothetical protein F4Y97_08000 [Dehalococcoidia bacterium]|nr:hypothetical protein [Dehalococcoidia bacterium]
MKITIIAALIGAIAIGGALGAFAATRTVETTAEVDVRVWRRVADGELYISARPEGSGAEGWMTSEALDMSERSSSGRYYLSSLVTVAVPVEVEVEVGDETDSQTERPATGSTPVSDRGLTTDLSLGTCCDVQGLDDRSDIQKDAKEIMASVIKFAWDTYGFVHRGDITINLSHSDNGMLVRYEQLFGERPAALPDACSFQRDEHMFFTPLCRLDEGAYAREWFARVLEPGDVEPSWIEHATLDYVPLHYAEDPPLLSDDRFRRAVFYENPRDLRRGRASDNMQSMGMLYAIDVYGDIKDWFQFYDRLLLGQDASVAFPAVFSATLPEFYGSFEEWVEHQKLILIASSFPSCVEASKSLRAQKGSVGRGSGFPDYRVPLAVDHDGDGIVCEDAFATAICVIPGVTQ